MRDKNISLQPCLFEVVTKQDELDLLEKKILIKLFGKTCIPDNMAKLLQIIKLNPNTLIEKFESKLSPFMNDNGYMNGTVIKQVISFTKYKDVCKLVNIPDNEFLLSDFFDDLFNFFIYGGNKNV